MVAAHHNDGCQLRSQGSGPAKGATALCLLRQRSQLCLIRESVAHERHLRKHHCISSAGWWGAHSAINRPKGKDLCRQSSLLYN